MYQLGLGEHMWERVVRELARGRKNIRLDRAESIGSDSWFSVLEKLGVGPYTLLGWLLEGWAQ